MISSVTSNEVRSFQLSGVRVLEAYSGVNGKFNLERIYSRRIYSEMILNGFFLSRLINLIKWCCFLNQFTKVTLRTFILFFGEIYSDKTFHCKCLLQQELADHNTKFWNSITHNLLSTWYGHVTSHRIPEYFVVSGEHTTHKSKMIQIR